jgi:hypothetical protein
MAAKKVKQKILEMLSRLPDDIDYDRAIETISLMQRLDVGRAQDVRGVSAPPTPAALPSELPTDDVEVPPHPHLPTVT